MNEKIALTHTDIYTEQGLIRDGYLKLVNGKIADIGSMNQLSNINDYMEYPLAKGYKVIPGMIDVHIHGVNGADTMDATTDALDIMAEALPKEGTTSFLATTITQNHDAIEAALVNGSNYIKNHQKNGNAELIGIHLEGPFLNKEMAGAQPVEHIVDPNIELFKKWNKLANNTIKLVTLAPERTGGLAFISYLTSNNIIASIGHSKATYQEVTEAISSGLTHVTHLYNQMLGFHHREPGVVGAAFLRDQLMVELIADGIHSSPQAIAIALQQKSSNKLVLITDAMRAKCLKNGTYDLGGQEVTVAEGKAVLKDGTLAGSVLRMSDAFKNIREYTACSYADAIAMSSSNAAKELGLYHQKGSIAIGKDADIVVLDEQDSIFQTFCRGHLAYQKGEN